MSDDEQDPDLWHKQRIEEDMAFDAEEARKVIQHCIVCEEDGHTYVAHLGLFTILMPAIHPFMKAAP